MKQLTALIFATMISSVTISAACAAAADGPIRFALHAKEGQNEIEARFSRTENGDRNQWNSSLAAAKLPGLDLASFRSSGSHSIRFAMSRESGRLDCAGTGGNFHASGECAFTADEGFGRVLAARGIRSPTSEQWLSLFALDVRRSLVDAIGSARYPAPTIDQLVGMTAVGVTGPYIQALAQAGYRPRSLDTLVQFKAIGIDPQWIGGLTRAGYGAMPSDQLVQLKALGVDGPYIQSFAAIGYRNLTADQLVQMKALGVTADFARRIQGQFGRVPPDKLVELRAIGFDRR